MFRWLRKLQRSELDGAALADEFLARSGSEERADRLPAWALLLRSPYETSKNASSWLGGVPHAPRDFNWPNDVDGTPLHFLAQIDLASLRPEPETGSCPPGLPSEGALLVFVGQSYACHILNAHDMNRAVPLILPDRLEPIRKHGFFGDARTFTHWPIDAVAYLDTGDERPGFFPDRFKQPVDWLANCGIAALDAEIVIDSLKIELSQGEQFEKSRRELGSALPDNEVIRSKIRHYALMRRRAPDLISALSAWRQMALSKSPEGRVDQAQLGELIRLRMALHDEMENYQPRFVLPGNANKVWERIYRNYPQLRKEGDYDALPAAYRPFVEARITGWRGHRLFGLEPPFPNNWEDLRGQDSLISIAADPLLCTESEHEYGMSVWCPRGRMAKGRYDKGQFVRHCAV